MVVSNTIPNPEASTSAWTRVRRLSRYVWGLDIGVENEKCLAISGMGFVGKTPAENIYEMQISASMAVRSPNPVYHQILSWPENERIDEKRFQEIFSDYVDFYNLGQQQIVAGLHQDTDYYHIHFVVNRFNIETGKMVQVNNGFDRNMGAIFCCFIENKYGYEPAPLAAAYMIGQELVLSDFYNVESASGYIDQKSKRFEAESAAQKIGHIARAILPDVKDWKGFQTGLAAKDISLFSPRKNGLVYCIERGLGKPVHVAASRVTRDLTLPALEQRFEEQFDAGFKPSLYEIAKQRAKNFFDQCTTDDSAVDGNPTYQRYSEPGVQAAELPNGVLQSLDDLSKLFSGSHVLFEKPIRGAGRRVHLLDRARGDPSPLSRSELIDLAPNIFNLAQRGYEIRLKPEQLSSATQSNHVALLGPSYVLPELYARGLFPALVDPGARAGAAFLFLNVSTQKHGQILKQAAQDLQLHIDFEPSVSLSHDAGFSALRVDVVHVEPPAPLPALISPPRLQFLCELQQRQSKLQKLLEALPRSGLFERLRKLSMLQRLQAAAKQLDWTSKGIENENTRRSRAPAQQFSAELRPTFGPALENAVGASGVGRGERGERRRSVDDEDASKRGTQSSGDGREFADHGSSVVGAGRGTLGEGPDTGQQARAGIRRNGDLPATSNVPELRHTEKSGDSASTDEPGREYTIHENNAHAGAIAQRVKICLPLAVRHAARLRFTRDSTDIDFIAIDDDRLMLRVSANDIMLSNDVPEALSRALTSKLDLPLVPAREPLDASEARSQTPKAGADKVANPDQDHSEKLPRPRRLILDSGGLTDSEELAGEKVFTISSPGELAGFDLSELQHLTYVTANKLDPAVPRIAEDLRAQALSRSMPPDLDVDLYMPEVVFEDAPRVLVLVFDPDVEMRRGPHPDHPDTLLIPVWTAAVADYVGIELHNIEMVVFHFQESGDAPGQDTVDSVNALRAGLEASLQPPLLDETPQFIESYGDCADAPWPSPFDDVDNDVDFSP